MKYMELMTRVGRYRSEKVDDFSDSFLECLPLGARRSFARVMVLISNAFVRITALPANEGSGGRDRPLRGI